MLVLITYDVNTLKMRPERQGCGKSQSSVSIMAEECKFGI